MSKTKFPNEKIEILYKNDISQQRIVEYPSLGINYENDQPFISNNFGFFKNNTVNPNIQTSIDQSGMKIINIQPSEPEIVKRQNTSKLISTTSSILENRKKCKIIATKIYCLSSEEIEKMSEVTCNVVGTQPGAINTIFDNRLGPIETGKKCQTCNCEVTMCSGHRGNIKLAKAFPHPFFKKILKLTLECVCHHCGHLYLTKDYVDAFSGIPSSLGEKRLRALAELSKKIHKLHKCPYIPFEYEKEYKNEYKLIYKIKDGPNEVVRERSMDTVQTILSVLTREELDILGYRNESHPKNFVMRHISVVPTCKRPTMYIDGMPKDNIVSTIYNQIIATNNRLEYATDKSLKLNYEHTIYQLINRLFDGDKDDKEVTLMNELKGKEGLFRNNISGKRVNFSARSVASPDCKLNFGEVSLPKYYQKVLTVDEKVTIYNYKVLSDELRKNGIWFIVYNGRDKNERITVSEDMSKNYELQIGDIITRSIRDRDALMIGRQPTLHAESFMGGTINLKNNLTIGLHSSMNAPFNADFDGDELNVHIIQDVAAQVEVLTCANVKFHIMNLQSSRPMMGLAYNAILSVYLMTSGWIHDEEKEEILTTEQFKKAKNVSLSEFAKIIGKKYSEVIIPEDRWESAISVVNMSSRVKTLNERCLKVGIHPRSGRALFSLVFPETFNLILKNKKSRTVIVNNKKETVVINDDIIIKNGILVSGTLNKTYVGTAHGSLIHQLTKLYSIKESCLFVNDGQKITDWFIMWHGFSIGYEAINSDRESILKMIIESANKSQYDMFILGPKPKDLVKQFFWTKKANTILSNTEEVGRQIGEKIFSPINPLNIMGDTGSKAKGSKANTAQITGSLGVQFIDGKLPGMEFNEGTRYLPTSPFESMMIEDFSYVIHSFYDGLTVKEVYSNQASSRKGLVDTANNTAEVGYLARRLRKCLENTYNDNDNKIMNGQRIMAQHYNAGINPAMLINTSSKKGGKIINCLDIDKIIHQCNSLCSDPIYYEKIKRAIQ